MYGLLKFKKKDGGFREGLFVFLGLSEYRRYGFGGVYLIVGRKWFTIKRGSIAP